MTILQEERATRLTCRVTPSKAATTKADRTRRGPILLDRRVNLAAIRFRMSQGTWYRSFYREVLSDVSGRLLDICLHKNHGETLIEWRSVGDIGRVCRSIEGDCSTRSVSNLGTAAKKCVLV